MCSGDAVLRTSRGTVHMGQCDGLQRQHLTVPISTMTYTAENPHADGSASPGARPHYQPPCHSDLPATSCTHDNWMESRQVPVVSKLPFHSHAAAKMSLHILIGPEPVLTSHARSPPATGSHRLIGTNKHTHLIQTWRTCRTSSAPSQDCLF